MKKKILKILAFVLALCLLGGVCLFANVMVGNPVSKALAKRSAQDYLIENHAGEGYEIKKVAYDWYNTEYLVECAVPGSLDRHFRVDTDFFGRVAYSSYEDDVLRHGNTVERLNDSYNELCDAVMDSAFFPSEIAYAFCRLNFEAGPEETDSEHPSSVLRMEDLQTDADYDICELAAKAGVLSVGFRDENATVERMCEILLALKKTADQAGFSFHAVSCGIDPPAHPADDAVYVWGFLYSDIYEEGLIDRVRLAIEN
ncbi:MAG: hypothetical protein E7523_06120 [Ruminococcaceae bacterium]|nr:hypothetical protein [Oscillospiraceae bacterium]